MRSSKAEQRQSGVLILKLTTRAESDHGESLLSSQAVARGLHTGKAEGDMEGEGQNSSTHAAESLLDFQNTHKLPLKTTARDCVQSCDGFQHVPFSATIKNTTQKECVKKFCFPTEKWIAVSAFCPHDRVTNLQGHVRLVLQRTSRDVVFLVRSIFRSILSIKPNALAVNALHNYSRTNFKQVFQTNTSHLHTVPFKYGKMFCSFFLTAHHRHK